MNVTIVIDHSNDPHAHHARCVDVVRAQNQGYEVWPIGEKSTKALVAEAWWSDLIFHDQTMTIEEAIENMHFLPCTRGLPPYEHGLS